MELTIKDKIDNEALKRQELVCTISYAKAVPSRKEVRDAICAATGADSSLLVIGEIKGSYGSNKAIVTARVYKNKDALSVEKGHLLKRDGIGAKDVSEAKKDAQKKPAHEKKEEAPKEMKKEAPKEKKEEPPKQDKKENAAKEGKEAPKQEKKEAPKDEKK